MTKTLYLWYHSDNEGGFLFTYNELEMCIDSLSSLLAFSDLAGTTEASGGDSIGTISTISMSRSLTTDAFDFIKTFFAQNILVKGANDINSVMGCLCNRSTSAESDV